MTDNEKICREFAKKHDIKFERGSEVGFGRPAVGFTYGTSYIDHNPVDMSTWESIKEFEDERLYAPVGANSYHKSDCLCVLVEDDEYDVAIDQLAAWVTHLESLGKVEIVEYQTRATGMQAMISGTTGRVVVVR